MKRKIPLAICYDFDGTLAPGNMQERDFLPALNISKEKFWTQVKAEAKKFDADEINIYMKLMLEKADKESVPATEKAFKNFGSKLELFEGVVEWFDRINAYGNKNGINISHHIISSGLREMIQGTQIAKHFENIYASSFCYDHHGVANWPALSVNYTTKTQYLFRINKGIDNVYDNIAVNKYVSPHERPVPFSNMVYLGDGDTDIPCFRLVETQGGTSIAVYKPKTRDARKKPEQLKKDGRVSFIASANYEENSELDEILKATIDKIKAESNYNNLK
ncbi:MAG: haloacid dehalogenase-like hydrolase [Rhizobiales bacterium]|nr:haloacid dehalogenase-like hydrolase [Hyphomicrobiales bacterium]